MSPTDLPVSVFPTLTLQVCAAMPMRPRDQAQVLMLVKQAPAAISAPITVYLGRKWFRDPRLMVVFGTHFVFLVRLLLALRLSNIFQKLMKLVSKVALRPFHLCPGGLWVLMLTPFLSRTSPPTCNNYIGTLAFAWGGLMGQANLNHKPCHKPY